MIPAMHDVIVYKTKAHIVQEFGRIGTILGVRGLDLITSGIT